MEQKIKLSNPEGLEKLVDKDTREILVQRLDRVTQQVEEMNITNDMSEKDMLALVRKCRPSDLSDAMDILGLVGNGTMSPEMRPIRTGISFAGIAYTVKLTPTQRSITPADTYKGFCMENARWMGNEYNYYAQIKHSDLTDRVIVFDMGGIPGGVVGSENSMAWKALGAVGVVCDGGARDSYECNLQGMNIFATKRTCNHVIGRVDGCSTQETIQCAGVTVRPGDIIAADDDGVLVIPRDRIAEVLKIAIADRLFDMQRRRDHYDELGMEADRTLDVTYTS